MKCYGNSIDMDKMNKYELSELNKELVKVCSLRLSDIIKTFTNHWHSGFGILKRRYQEIEYGTGSNKRHTSMCRSVTKHTKTSR